MRDIYISGEPISFKLRGIHPSPTDFNPFNNIVDETIGSADFYFPFNKEIGIGTINDLLQFKAVLERHLTGLPKIIL
jgi:hypothetical protein